MKKTLFRISALVIAILLGYSIYIYLDEDYKPKKRRQFYKSKYKEKVKKKKKFVPRGQKHEFVPEQEAQEEPVENTQNGFGVAVTMDFDDLKRLSRECEQKFKEYLPKEEIIDPENDFFNYGDNLFKTLDGVEDLIGPRFPSVNLMGSLKQELARFEEYDSNKFYRHLRDAMVCRKGELSLFIESLYEASVSKKWSEEQIATLNKELIPLVHESLTSDYLPDNILFSLNVLRSAGANVYGDEYVSELDEIYQKVSEFEDGFFTEIGQEKQLQDPAGVLQAYLTELEIIADEVRYIMTQRYFDSFNAD